MLCVLHLLSSVHEMDCLREETVPVSGRSGAQSSEASTRRSKRVCAECEGSKGILPAFLLTLDSWRVYVCVCVRGGGGVVPMILSGVRPTLRSLLRSDLVAELNQTVIDVQRTDSMWLSHFRSWRREIVVPRNLNDSTAVTVLFMMASGGEQGGFSPEVHDHLHSVLSVLSSRLLRLHQTASSLTPCLLADSSQSWMRPISVVSSANFKSLTEGFLDVQSLV